MKHLLLLLIKMSFVLTLFACASNSADNSAKANGKAHSGADSESQRCAELDYLERQACLSETLYADKSN